VITKNYLLLLTRGGQRPAKPDPPDITGRPEPPPARPRDQLRTDTDIIIIIIFFFSGFRVVHGFYDFGRVDT
jgi:hypothetical protein